jgi:RNA polymerase sigma-70 factor (ECF subfamily)
MHPFVLALLFSTVSGGLNKATVQFDASVLVKRAQTGDHEAVGLLYEAYVQVIHRFVLYRVGNTKDAEDITAEVFVQMVEGLPAYRVTEAPFAAWLFRIASSRVADYYRHHLRHPHEELPEMLPDISDLPEDIIMQNQTFEKLREALSKLTEEQQHILVLRFVERRSHEDVAAMLNRSVTAVKSAQHRALTKLTQLLGIEQKARHYLRGSE